MTGIFTLPDDKFVYSTSSVMMNLTAVYVESMYIEYICSFFSPGE